MSRIGKKPISIPSGVSVKLADRTVNVAGPKGTLAWTVPSIVSIAVDEASKTITVTPGSREKIARAMWGTARSLISNMVTGVTAGYEKKLEVYGTGYSCKLQGRNLHLNVGFMGRGVGGKPQFDIPVPEGLEIDVEVPAARGDTEPAKFTVKGADKQKVGQFAAEVRAIRTPEPYKGKGIRYAGEQVRRKQGKAFASGAK